MRAVVLEEHGGPDVLTITEIPDPKPGPDEVMGELLWVIDRAEEHMGTERAGRYLRKFYPWYLDQLDVPKLVRNELCQSADLDRARELVGQIRDGEAVAV